MTAPLPAHRLCVAPMMDWTDRHDRFFLRLLAPEALLYTEMVTAAAIRHGDRDHLLQYNAEEHPVALQLGGSDPAELAEAAREGAERGYDEINLNVGCPSDRVQRGRFGACLMAEPELVADCCTAMREAVAPWGTPVTVKCRLGIDDRDDWDFLDTFVSTVRDRGDVTTFILHARKAILQGLSPKENREVPPLRYERVYRLKRTYPDLTVVINGGIREVPAIIDHLEQTDGVMLGREAYQRPWVMVGASRAVFGDDPRLPADRHAALEAYLPYVAAQCAAGVPLKHMARHVLGLFHGCPGGKRFRRHVSERSHLPGVGPELLREAMALVPRDESEWRQVG